MCLSGRDYVNSTLQDASNKEVAGIAIVVLVLMVSPIIIILMRNAVATIQVCIHWRYEVADLIHATLFHRRVVTLIDIPSTIICMRGVQRRLCDTYRKLFNEIDFS